MSDVSTTLSTCRIAPPDCGFLRSLTNHAPRRSSGRPERQSKGGDTKTRRISGLMFFVTPWLLSVMCFVNPESRTPNHRSQITNHKSFQPGHLEHRLCHHRVV